MDPLSVSASITSLLQLTGTVIQYLNTAKGASEERRTILLELSSISGMLYTLQDQAVETQPGNPWSSTLGSLSMPNGPIEQFKTALERLAKKLAPVKGWKEVGKAVIWPFQKEEVKEILSTIERQKSLFNMARQNHHMYGHLRFLHQVISIDMFSDLSKAIKGEIGEIGEKLSHLQIRQSMKSPCPLGISDTDRT